MKNELLFNLIGLFIGLIALLYVVLFAVRTAELYKEIKKANNNLKKNSKVGFSFKNDTFYD